MKARTPKEPRYVEGVPYYCYRVSFKLAGKRIRVTHWSPGQPWLREEVQRMLEQGYDAPSGTRVIVERALDAVKELHNVDDNGDEASEETSP